MEDALPIAKIHPSIPQSGIHGPWKHFVMEKICTPALTPAMDRCPSLPSRALEQIHSHLLARNVHMYRRGLVFRRLWGTFFDPKSSTGSYLGMEAQISGIDEVQRALLAEELILTDAEDRVIGRCSKADAHLVSNNLPLHRAFSVFLFDEDNRLILQQRAATKVTFPLLWANTCCSHPLFNPDECNVSDPVLGVKRAALRKLQQELGLTGLHPDDLSYLTRIRYRAVCRTNTAWGEHEVDYILLARKKVVLDGSTGTGLRVEPNANEVAAVKACTREDIYKLLQHQADTLTPWFRMIARTLLPEWWQNLGAALAQQRPYFDPIRIHDLGTS